MTDYVVVFSVNNQILTLRLLSNCSVFSHNCIKFDDIYELGTSYFFLVNFDFLLKYHVSNRDSEKGKTALKMAVKTLKCMSNGGIHDHIGYVSTYSQVVENFTLTHEKTCLQTSFGVSILP